MAYPHFGSVTCFGSRHCPILVTQGHVTSPRGAGYLDDPRGAGRALVSPHSHCGVTT